MPDFKLTVRTSEAIEELERVLAIRLEEIGIRAEDYAQRLTPVGTPKSTGIAGYRGGTLRKSITHKVVGDRHKIGVYIGTNVKSPEGAPYAVYVELGTGVHAANKNGRKSPWMWVDKNGKEHWTTGMKPNHMLKRSIADHVIEYKKILKKT